MKKTPVNSAIVSFKLYANLQILFGIFIAYMFGRTAINALALPTKESDFVFVFVLLLAVVAAGIYLVWLGIKRKKLYRLFRLYLPKLSNDPEQRSIDALARATNTPVETVIANLDKMIKRGFLPTASIDLNHNCLVLSTPHGKECKIEAVDDDSFDTQEDNCSIEMDVHKNPYTIVVCHECHATNRIFDPSVENCVFCATLLPRKKQ